MHLFCLPIKNIIKDSNNDSKPLRDKQNKAVLFELGNIMGKLGRNRVCCLYNGSIEMSFPDLVGIGGYNYEGKVEECYRFIVKELSNAGYLNIIN